jgi:hypothetical protein
VTDTIDAVDGRPDLVRCGLGTDVAIVDRFDRAFGCETGRRS